MKKNLSILLVFLFCLAGCGEVYRYSKSGEVGWALKKAIRDERKHEVIVKELTHFNWDELFLFSPYEPTSEVCKRLGLSPAECKTTIKDQSTDDGVMLMVFRNKGKVIHVEMHFRWHGDFTPVPDKPFTPASAIFVVVPDGKGASGEEWLRLRPKTAPTN